MQFFPYLCLMKKFFAFIITLALAANLYARHYTVVVSLDGFRWDYPQLYNTPFIDYMASQGVESGLIPSFPSKTFPNHYTLATGLYPDHHGIVGNDFYDSVTKESFSLSSKAAKTDSRFYGGEPVWITAQKQGLHTTVFYWPGSDVKVKGSYPDKFFKYDELPRLDYSQRIDSIIHELEKPASSRPELIMAYFDQPDASGHLYGPHNKHTRKMVAIIDSLMQNLYNRIQQLPVAADVNLIILSDHGMAWVAKEHQIRVMPYLKKEWIRKISGNVPANIYTAEGCADSVYTALSHIDHIKVWKKADIPAYLHYGSSPRVGDVVATPDVGYYIIEDTIDAGGTHGYDPELQDMHALFRAIGPDFNHVSAPHFHNVNVYALICRLLGITPAPNDGNIKETEILLKESLKSGGNS